MDDVSVASHQSINYCYSTCPQAEEYNKYVKSASVYGSAINPKRAYSEQQDAILRGKSRDDSTHIDDRALFPDDTIHYMSPVSPLSDRTRNEGDDESYIRHLIRLEKMHHRAFPQPVSTFTSSSDTNVSCEFLNLVRTVAIIKPEAMKYEPVIVRAIKEAGFTIVGNRKLHLSPEQASEVYAQHYGSNTFPHMVISMSVGPVRVLSLAAPNAMSRWRELIAPAGTLREEWFFPLSMRTRYGIQSSMPGALKGSETMDQANKENRFFFPNSVLEPIEVDQNRVEDFCKLYVNATLLEGLAELVRVKPIDPILFLAEWLLLNNPYQPTFPDAVAVTAT